MVIEIPGHEPQDQHKPRVHPSLAVLITMLVAVVVYGATQSDGSPDSGETIFIVDTDHPGLADVEWTPVDGPWLVAAETYPPSAMVRTDDRIIMASRKDWRAVILESTDNGATWNETYLHDRIGSRVVHGTSTATEAYLLGTGLEGPMLWHSTDDQPQWSATVIDDLGLEEAVVARLHVGSNLVAVGQGGHEGRVRSFVWFSEDGSTGTSTMLPVSGDADVIANSAAMMGDTIVAGGLLARGVTDRYEDPFPDDTWRKPVVWTSTDRGATWVQHILRPSGDLKGVVTDIFVADGRFYASGYISNAAPTTLDFTDVDIALWSSGNGSTWTGKITPSPGNDFVKAVLRDAVGWHLFGGTRVTHGIGDDDWERATDTKIWTLHDDAWQTPTSVALDVDLFSFEGLVPTTEGWLMAISVHEDFNGWDLILLEGTAGP